jgi:hypothetical protein
VRAVIKVYSKGFISISIRDQPFLFVVGDRKALGRIGEEL